MINKDSERVGAENFDQVHVLSKTLYTTDDKYGFHFN